MGPHRGRGRRGRRAGQSRSARPLRRCPSPRPPPRRLRPPPRRLRPQLRPHRPQLRRRRGTSDGRVRPAPRSRRRASPAAPLLGGVSRGTARRRGRGERPRRCSGRRTRRRARRRRPRPRCSHRRRCSRWRGRAQERRCSRWKRCSRRGVRAGPCPAPPGSRRAPGSPRSGPGGRPHVGREGDAARGVRGPVRGRTSPRAQILSHVRALPPGRAPPRGRGMCPGSSRPRRRRAPTAPREAPQGCRSRCAWGSGRRRPRHGSCALLRGSGVDSVRRTGCCLCRPDRRRLRREAEEGSVMRYILGTCPTGTCRSL